jgi:hypothetical protein
LKPIFIIIALTFAAFAGASSAAVTETPALPEFDMMHYCHDLTSKMLVKSEQARETAICVYWESISKAQLQNHWSLVTPAALKECMKYQPLSRQAYIYLRSCVSYSIGLQCLKDAASCTSK